mgnify:CR=1 FL=1
MREISRLLKAQPGKLLRETIGLAGLCALIVTGFLLPALAG